MAQSYQHVALVVQLPPLLRRGGMSLAAGELRDVTEQAALGVQQELRENFERRQSSFWAQASRSTILDVTSAGEALVITQHTGVRLRWKGGVVHPGKGISSKSGAKTKLLALPTEGGKKSPGDYKGLLTFRAVDGGGGARRGTRRRGARLWRAWRESAAGWSRRFCVCHVCKRYIMNVLCRGVRAEKLACNGESDLIR